VTVLHFPTGSVAKGMVGLKKSYTSTKAEFILVSDMGKKTTEPYYGNYRVQEEISDQIDRGAVPLSPDNPPSPDHHFA